MKLITKRVLKTDGYIQGFYPCDDTGFYFGFKGSRPDVNQVIFDTLKIAEIKAEYKDGIYWMINSDKNTEDADFIYKSMTDKGIAIEI